MVQNAAFCFIKPHAVTDKAKALVHEVLEKRGIKFMTEGEISAKDIDERMLVDKHYYSIASKATMKKPKELNVPKDKFKATFDMDWDEALAQNKVYNAKDACEKLGVDSMKLLELNNQAQKVGKLVKFGGGFYCGLLEHEGTKLFVMNAFFMALRSKFVKPGAMIYWYLVEWDSANCPWEAFRSEVVGPTDPTKAPADSIRGRIAAAWEELGLEAACNTQDNGFHASASPFEAFAERLNWLGKNVEDDEFGKQLLAAKLPKDLIDEWTNDPQVSFGDPVETKSLFDCLEDMNTDICLRKCQEIAGCIDDSDESKAKKAKIA